MEGTKRQQLLETLASLQEDELQRWKQELSKIPLQEGYEHIPPAVLETAAPAELAELLISHYGEDYGLQVALRALISCRGTTDTSTAAMAEPQLYLRDIMLVEPKKKRVLIPTVKMKQSFPFPSLPTPLLWLRKLSGSKLSGTMKKGKHEHASPGKVASSQHSQGSGYPAEGTAYGHASQKHHALRPELMSQGGQKMNLGGKTQRSTSAATVFPPPQLEPLGGKAGRPTPLTKLAVPDIQIGHAHKFRKDLNSSGGALASAGSSTKEAEPTCSSAAGNDEAEETIYEQILLPSLGFAAAGAGEARLREYPICDPWAQDKCELCPSEEHPSEEIHPESVLGPDGNQKTYRVYLPGPGSFRCSETELGFDATAAVTIQYGYTPWDQGLSASEKQQWMVAGPLFDIQVKLAGAVTAIHLPHFLCLAGGEADISRMRIAHFIDGGMILQEPTRVRPFHAVLENPSFSPLGVLWRKIQAKCQAKVHSLALLYQALRAANTTLHLYLIPNDHSLRQAVHDFESQCPSVRLHKPSRTKPLKFGSCCAVSSSSQLEVMPEELEYCYLGPKLEQPYLEIYTPDMQQGLDLRLMEKSEGEPIWKVLVRPEDVMLGVSSAQMAREEHFIDRHREQLIQRVRQVDGVLDKLYGTVLDEEQYQSIRAERTDPQKMRKLYDLLPSWDRACKEHLYQVLKAKQKFLIQELKGT